MKKLKLLLVLLLSIVCNYAIAQDIHTVKFKGGYDLIKLNIAPYIDANSGLYLQPSFERYVEFPKAVIDLRVSYNFAVYNMADMSFNSFRVQGLIGYKITDKAIISIAPMWFDGTLPRGLHNYQTPSSIVFTVRYTDRIHFETWFDVYYTKLPCTYNAQFKVSYNILSTTKGTGN